MDFDKSAIKGTFLFIHHLNLLQRRKLFSQMNKIIMQKDTSIVNIFRPNF